jgi:phytoene dehydrogenase-like protein
MQPSQRIAIVGAGIGGLATGHFLQEAGRDVAIYERASLPGGRIQLLEREDYYGHSTIETVVRSARRATNDLLAASSPG